MFLDIYNPLHIYNFAFFAHIYKVIIIGVTWVYVRVKIGRRHLFCKEQSMIPCLKHLKHLLD